MSSRANAPRTSRTVTGLITTALAGASASSRAAILGVSPSARCSCRPPPPMTPTTTGPVWMPRRTASCTPYCPIRRGIAKVDQQAITEILGDMTRVLQNDRGGGLLVGADHRTQVFRVELARE